MQIKLFIFTLLTLVLLDSFWLLFVAKDFYNKHLGFLFAPKVNMIPIVLFYIIYSIGLVFLITNQSILSNQSLINVFIKGAVLGLLSYGAYDLTNQATIQNWPTIVTIVDILWGITVTSLAVSIPFYLVKFFGL